MDTPPISKDKTLLLSSSYPPSNTPEKFQSQQTGKIWATIYSYTIDTVCSVFFRKQPELNLTTQEQKKEFELLFQKKKQAFTKICSNIQSEDYFYYEQTNLFPYSFFWISGKTSYIFLKTRSRRFPEKKYPRLGKGSNASVTLCYDFQVQGYKVCRSLDKKLVKRRELELNECLAQKNTQSYSDYFATAEIYPYKKRGKDEKKPWKQGEKVAFIMTYYEHGDLCRALASETLAPLLAKKKRELIQHILKSLDILHTELEWVWNDLKPANILLTKDLEPRLTDFGSACKIGDTCHPIFTPLYKCPEDEISTKRDIWSLGVCLVDIIYGPNVWKEKMFGEAFTFEVLVILSNEEEITKRLDEWLSKETRNNPKHPDSLIYWCLQYDPNKRPPAKELLKLLETIEF